MGPESDCEGEEFLQRASCRILLHSCEVVACKGACYIKQSWTNSSSRFHIEVLRQMAVSHTLGADRGLGFVLSASQNKKVSHFLWHSLDLDSILVRVTSQAGGNGGGDATKACCRAILAEFKLKNPVATLVCHHLQPEQHSHQR